ncbi:MAG TPA: hypothetical protein VF993_01600 [Myxococcales bacterium]
MSRPAAADPQSSPSGRLVVAAPLEQQNEDGLARVSWPRTIWRLLLQPDAHPWSSRWRLRRRAPLVAVALALLLLLLFAAGGCASVPPQSLRDSAAAPPTAEGLRCETVLVSHEVEIPAQGELADVRLTIENLPPVAGKLRVLVRQPAFESGLQLGSDPKADFDKVLDVSPASELTLVLLRPRWTRSDWPRRECTACSVNVELTGLFGAREGLETFFSRAVQEAAAVEAGFLSQAQQPAAHPGAALRQLAEEASAEAKRCGVPLEPALRAVLAALEQLDDARAQLYAADADLPDADAVLRSWDAATAAIEAQPAVLAAARAARWPASVRYGSRLRASALHLELASQLTGLSPEDKRIAARWVALATVRDIAALEKRSAALPPIRDLADAEARLHWVNPRPASALPVPGLSRPALLRVREWAAPPKGRRCIGRRGAAPVRDPDADATAVAQMFGADERQHFRIAHPSDIAAAREMMRRAADLLCNPPSPDVTELFKGLDERELGPVAGRLDDIYRESDPLHENDEIARTVLSRTNQLLCRLFDVQTVQKRISSVVGYKVFVEGGAHLLEYLPGPLICGDEFLTPRDVRRRLREAYRDALEKHALRDRLCPQRAGKCPEEIAASVRRLFALQRPLLAGPAPAESRLLDFPPPFGFGEPWVQKLDRCARDACDALLRLHGEAPAGQFESALCPPRIEGAEQPTEITLASPEAPSSITLSSCDAHVGVRVTLHRTPDAGTLVAIASSHQFRYGSESVNRQGRHPQLGRIYERVADLTDSGDVSRRGEGTFEVALTPTVENQVFYFFSLRRRDY